MPLHPFLIARLKMTRDDLNGVIAHLTDADTTWAPREGMKTVGELLLEIANKDREIVGYLKKGEWPDDEPGPFEADKASLDEMQAGLGDTRQATLEYLAANTEEHLEETITLPERWWEALRLLECPRSEMIRNISAHEWYHTGQLITYLWSRGDDPYDWV